MVKSTFLLFLMSVLLFQSQTVALTITHGPYLQEMEDNAVTIMWLTDKPATSKVEYGKAGVINMITEETLNGVLTVSTLHNVRLTGLKPGTEYTYKISSTEVTDFSPDNPSLGQTETSSEATFKTYDKNSRSCSFLVVTDIHSQTAELKTFMSYTNWDSTDFMVFDGDVLDDLSEKDSARIYSQVLAPCDEALGGESPFVFVRGNHEMRGSLTPHLAKYFTHTSGEWYYGFYNGPAYFFIFDSGEDKKDNVTNFGGLIRCEPYRAKQKEWFRSFSEAKKDFLDEFPVKVAFSHCPNWGYGSNYDDVANAAGLDLLISGHTHSYNYSKPANGREYHRLTIGRHQCAKVDIVGTIDSTVVTVTTYGSSGYVHDSFKIVKEGQKVPNINSSKNVLSGQDLDKLYKQNHSAKVKNGIVLIDNRYKGLSKEVSIYQLNGRLIDKIVTTQQRLNLKEMNAIATPSDGVYVVKVKAIKETKK